MGQSPRRLQNITESVTLTAFQATMRTGQVFAEGIASRMSSTPENSFEAWTDDYRPQPSERDIAELRNEAHKLGLTQLAFRDDSSAPEVDHELLLALAARQLPEPVARLVYWLVYSFESWHEAFTKAVIQYARDHTASPASGCADQDQPRSA